MVYGSVKALANASTAGHTSMICVFDHEEIGSGSRQGALSPVLSDLLKEFVSIKRIIMKIIPKQSQIHLSYQPIKLMDSIPTILRKRIRHINGNSISGPVIKVSSSMNYSSDGNSIAVIKNLCGDEILYQIYVNRSDIQGGSTLGPLLSRQVSIAGVDIGNPIYITFYQGVGGVKDQKNGWKNYSLVSSVKFPPILSRIWIRILSSIHPWHLMSLF